MTATLTSPPRRQIDPEDLAALNHLFHHLWQTGEAKGYHAAKVRPGETEPRRATFAERLLLLSTEISETYEEYRDGRGMDEVYYSNAAPGKPEGIPMEIADILIRLADLIVEHNIPIGMAVAVKDRYNQVRTVKKLI